MDSFSVHLLQWELQLSAHAKWVFPFPPEIVNGDVPEGRLERSLEEELVTDRFSFLGSGLTDQDGGSAR